MTDVLAILSDVKHYVAGLGALGALLFDKKLGPSNDDLPASLKILLVVPLGFAIFYSKSIDDSERLNFVIFDIEFLFLSVVVYMGLWMMFGYVKTFYSPKSWWRFWGDPYVYTNKRVMGGRLTSTARADLQRLRQAGDDVSIQEYFAGNAFDQDRVWTRSSRLLLQILLVLSYVSTAYFLFSSIVLMLET